MFQGDSIQCHSRSRQNPVVAWLDHTLRDATMRALGIVPLSCGSTYRAPNLIPFPKLLIDHGMLGGLLVDTSVNENSFERLPSCL